jgi:hypothetical protein
MSGVVKGPQSPNDSRQVPRSVDENGNIVFGQVGFQELDFGAAFGGSATSSSQNTVGYGIKTFTLDQDVDDIREGRIVQVMSHEPSCFLYGIVTRRDTTTEPVEIDVLTLKTSPVTNDSAQWTIQICQLQGLEAELVAYSSTSHSISEGSKTFTTQSGKFIPTRSGVLIIAIESRANKMFGYVTSYSGTSLVVNVTDAFGSGTHTSWLILAGFNLASFQDPSLLPFKHAFLGGL